MRAAARRLLGELPAHLAVTAEETLALLQMATSITRDCDDEELSRFLRTGRLPELMSLTPKQMEYVRGGRLALTATRGLAPATILVSLCRVT